MEIASKLNHLKKCTIRNLMPKENLLKIVDAFPKLPNLISIDVDDELLKLLASKSNKSNPLKKLALGPSSGFPIDAVEHFLKRATFVDESLIVLTMNVSLPEVEEMFKRIDKYKVILLKQKAKEVEMMVKKIDEEIFIIFVMLMNL
uniref:Uncharacterized protein n=1 Tax=Panagrolaimus sp. JU765 TaxID=591449 RepID=A0AC34QEX3_9BILA